MPPRAPRVARSTNPRAAVTDRLGPAYTAGMNTKLFIVMGLAAFCTSACGDGTDAIAPAGSGLAALNPDSAPQASVDRFSDESGMLMRRSANPNLPGPNMPIDFDQEPFITRGLGPEGESVLYYNFDIQPSQPAPIYVLFREGEDAPVADQLNIIDAIPGVSGYNDFWRVTRVTVPPDYVENSATSLEDLTTAGYPIEATDMLVNCPVVPAGSTASLRWGSEDAGLVRGWYDGQVVYYFGFNEHPLVGSTVPIAPIYVTFNLNPDQEGGGPPSGFVTEADSDQTHNVLAALPGSADYSPLWAVSPFDNADFTNVSDLESAEAANVLAEGVANVNCPVVDMN